MLKFTRLEVEDFGPFKGHQIVEFPERGVTIVYGENMKGKTKLLNAIRYALYGKVLSRGSRKESLHNVGNWEAADEGRYGFKVVLCFESGNTPYVLTRRLLPGRNVLVPQSDYDYQEEFFLQKNGYTLNPVQRDAELAQIMPEQVSRFFLFDGELLQEYEELLRDDSSMGKKISDAIERILGVPILTNARADLDDLRQSAQRAATKAAQRNHAAQQLGIHYDERTETKQHLETEVAKKKEELADYEAEKAALEQDLRKTERIKAQLDEIDEKQRLIEQVRLRQEAKQEKLKEVMAGAWKGMLAQRMAAIERQFVVHQIEIQERIQRRSVVSQMWRVVDSGFCEVCGQTVASHARSTILTRLQELDASGSAAEDEEHLQQIGRRLHTIRTLQLQDQRSLVTQLVDDINEATIEITTARDRIRDLREFVKDFDQSVVRAQYAEYDKLVKRIGEAENGILAQEIEIAEVEDTIRKLRDQISRASGAISTRESRKSDLYERLYDLFDRGVVRYRDLLRQQVEHDASLLFRRLTSESDYDSLKINDSYGLRIMHRDGKEVPIRSAGAEHIVALSLMGALQKNAPLSGPIVMDSPFGRLDETHTNNVIRALPEMAEQVILLVYRHELDANTAHEILGQNLQQEYRLERRTARHTQIAVSLE
jgi:DNA sulfur modification protein DndD